jgi:hypothetical protein
MPSTAAPDRRGVTIPDELRRTIVDMPRAKKRDGVMGDESSV